MARMYHMTEKGPKRCRKPKQCHLEHSETREGAVALHKAKVARLNNRKKQAELQQKLKNLTNDQKVRIVYDLVDRAQYGRHFANKAQEVYNRTGARPEYVDAVFTGRVDSGSDHPAVKVSFAAVKSYEIIGNPAHVSQVWGTILTDERGGREYENKHGRYSVDTPQEARMLTQAVYKMVTDALRRTGASQEDIEEKRSQILDAFINGIKSVDTVELGAARAHRLGYSYFKGSDKNKIVVTADYAETAISPQDIHDFIQSNDYRDTNPDVQITIQDSDAKRSKAFWTASYKNNRWTISTVDRRGNASIRNINTPAEAGRIVRDFSRNEMRFTEHRAGGAATFIEYFVRSIDPIREYHRAHLQTPSPDTQKQTDVAPATLHPVHSLLTNESEIEDSFDPKTSEATTGPDEITFDEGGVLDGLYDLEDRIRQHEDLFDKKPESSYVADSDRSWVINDRLEEKWEWRDQIAELAETPDEIQRYTDERELQRKWHIQDYDGLRLDYAQAYLKEHDHGRVYKTPEELIKIARKGL